MSKNPLTQWMKGESIPGIPKYELSRDEILLLEEWVRCRDSGKIPLAVQARIEELKKKWEAVESPGIGWFYRQSARTTMARSKASIADGKMGGDAANLTGDDKALHLAKAIRKKSPSLSDRKVADKVKLEGGSSVSNSAESLRKKIAGWVVGGSVPAKVGQPARKPEAGRKRK